MAIATISKPSSAGIFPSQAVESKLRGALLQSVQSTAAVQGIALPPTNAEQCATRIHLDSLEVVDLLCDVESIVGFELKDSIVKAGGYQSINEALAHVLPRIEAAWLKRVGKGGSK